LPDENNGTKVYTYTRKGEFKECKSAKSQIDLVYFYSDGIPIGGDGPLVTF